MITRKGLVNVVLNCKRWALMFTAKSIAVGICSTGVMFIMLRCQWPWNSESTQACKLPVLQLSQHSNNFSAGFATWNAPENHSCPTRGGIFNIASNDRYGPARSVFCYCWGLWTVVIWPKIVGNMCTWENTELWGEAAKKAGVLTWSSFRLNSEF